VSPCANMQLLGPVGHGLRFARSTKRISLRAEKISLTNCPPGRRADFKSNLAESSWIYEGYPSGSDLDVSPPEFMSLCNFPINGNRLSIWQPPLW